MIKHFNTLFVTMFGLGKIKKIPGTFGSFATIIILYSLFHIFNISSTVILLSLITIFIFSFFAVANHIKDNENKDPNEIIIDEFIGQSIPIYLYEISHGSNKSSDEAIIFYVICFILFRIFDIVKWLYFIPGIIFAGITNVDQLWKLANISVALSAIPNLIALLFLSGVFIKLMRDYFSEQRKFDTELIDTTRNYIKIS